MYWNRFSISGSFLDWKMLEKYYVRQDGWKKSHDRPESGVYRMREIQLKQQLLALKPAN